MAQLKRFGFALQALIVLASSGEHRSSSELAEHIRGEPTQLRKILAQLSEAGIVEVRQGRGGGYQLARKPELITLAEIYRSLHEEEPQWDRMLETTGDHHFGQKVHESFRMIMNDITIQIDQVLAGYTIADLLD